MQPLIVLPVLFGFSLISGMLGIGVAFAAVPLLSLFMSDLVNQVHPLSLVLNGVTALFSVFGFLHAGLVRWRKAILLCLPTTLGAPLGAVLAHYLLEIHLWLIYFIAVSYLLYEIFFAEVATDNSVQRFPLAWWLAFPISAITGMIGVGPGFLLVPVLAKCGVNFKEAAALNAVAVVPSSFAAASMHLSHAHIEAGTAALLLGCGAAGALLGSILSSRVMPTLLLKRILGVTILVVTLYKIAQLLGLL
ncbi:MAG: sulfite exporter TauE/SafE family protein [Betaproteobacteria bacterium]|nr:sulfite exporter TauE/SafE family protein [Betaproteobacteria bacterium]